MASQGVSGPSVGAGRIERHTDCSARGTCPPAGRENPANRDESHDGILL